MTEYYFNTRTGLVEQLENRGQAKDLLGPYPTYEQAAAALTTAAERTQQWDEEDRKWRGDQD